METKGIVIRVSSFRDFDCMITMITETGLVSFLARGVKKITSKNAYLINTFNFVNVYLMNGKDGYFLKNGKLIESFPNVKSDIEKLAALDFIGEITNLFVQKDEARNIFSFLLTSLEMLNQNIEPKMVATLYFAKVLQYSGYSIEVNCCQKCLKTTDIIGFSVIDGGFICRDCFDSLNHVKLDPTTLKQIRYIFMVDVDNFYKVIFNKNDCINVIKLLNQFVKDVVQVDLKSISLLLK